MAGTIGYVGFPTQERFGLARIYSAKFPPETSPPGPLHFSPRMQRALKERAMQKVADRVMQTYGLMKPQSEEDTEQTREVLLDFLSKRPGTNDHKATVEGLTFLKNLKT